jgi:hypothetical protein
LYFRPPGRGRKKNVAAVAQSYHDEEPILTREEGLLMPPDPWASFWYPGWTTFVVITSPDVEVKFLPEQDGRLAGLWSRPRMIKEAAS